MSNTQPFYQIRPRKHIDRQIFIRDLLALSTISSIDFSTYTYVGFGSITFDDFKLMHDNLHITKLISLEADSKRFQRAMFNNPYQSIRLINKSSEAFVNQFDKYCGDDPGIILWLDYTSASNLDDHLSDITAYAQSLGPNDILRVTLNANVGSVFPDHDTGAPIPKELRPTAFAELIGTSAAMVPIDPDAYTTATLPTTLIRLVSNKVNTSISGYRMLPICTTKYEDGQQMVTMTFIGVTTTHSDEELPTVTDLYDALTLEPCFRDNIDSAEPISVVEKILSHPITIDIPEFTLKELLTLTPIIADINSKKIDDKFIKKDEQNVLSLFSVKQIQMLCKFYQMYPTFQNVSI